MVKLTARTVAKLTLPEGKREQIYWDEQLRGFGLRLRAGGSAVWIAQYRMGARTRRITLGKRETTPPERARRLAAEILGRAKAGFDPQAEKAEARARAAVTLGSMVGRYLDARVRRELSARSVAEFERYLLRYWRPLHGLALAEIVRADIAAVLEELARERGGITANRARGALSAFWSWAMAQGLVEGNPLVGLPKPARERARDRVLDDEEIREIWHATGGSGAYDAIVRLLILTGQRREEVAGMRWSELDAERTLWRIPAERTKNGRPHEVPLSLQARAVLEAVPRLAGRDLVFGSGERTGYQAWSGGKKRLDARILEDRRKAAKAAGRDPTDVAPMRPWILHDIRRTVATRLAELGTLPHVVEAVLNHLSGVRAGVAGIYNRAVYAKEKRQALTLWGEHVAAVTAERPAKVVPLSFVR